VPSRAIVDGCPAGRLAALPRQTWRHLWRSDGLQSHRLLRATRRAARCWRGGEKNLLGACGPALLMRGYMACSRLWGRNPSPRRVSLPQSHGAAPGEERVSSGFSGETCIVCPRVYRPVGPLGQRSQRLRRTPPRRYKPSSARLEGRGALEPTVAESRCGELGLARGYVHSSRRKTS
jgi:hypothetical protein